MALMGIPPDISYGLQCSVECFDISEDVMTFFYRFNERVDLAALIDNSVDDEKPLGANYRVDIAESLRRSALTNYYRPYNKWFWTDATPDERTWCLASAAQSAGRQSAEVIDYLITRYISDCLATGLEPNLAIHQNKWLDDNRNFHHVRKIYANLRHKLEGVGLDDLVYAIVNPETFINRLPMIEEPRYRHDYDPETGTVNMVRVKRDLAAEKRKRNARRKVAKKSANFLSRLIGQPQTSLFIGGEAIEVEGERFTFSVRKNQLFSLDHGALKVEVLERQSKDRLFGLCWYVDKTPPMDQIAAMILAVQSGDEEEIIRIGNKLSISYENVHKHAHLDLDIKTTANPWNREVDAPIERILDRTFEEIDRIGHSGNFLTGIVNGSRDEWDDNTCRLTVGTHAYWRNNADVYLDFSRRCVTRWMTGFKEPMRNVFQPHRPETVRPIFNNVVGQELIHGPRVEAVALLTA